MPLRFAFPVLLLLGVSACVCVAESTDCTAPVLMIPDGRLTQGTVPAGTTYWYGVYAIANHSYSVEFEPPADNFLNSFRPQFNGITVYGPSDTLLNCRGTSSVTVTPNSGYAPTILKNSNGAGRRVSFIAQSSGLHLISATNVMGAGNYSFRAVDTTLVNIRWNTLAGSDVQWVIMNVSDMWVTGYITVVDMTGQIVTSVLINLPPGGRIPRSSSVSDLNIPRNMAGSALFSHNGPPGAIMAEAFMISPTATIPERFGPINNP